MRIADLILLPLDALRRQRLRATLTTLGVVFGAFVLAASLSIGRGVEARMAQFARGSDLARRVEVYRDWSAASAAPGADDVAVEGDLSPARRDRLRKALSARRRQSRAQSEPSTGALTRERLAKLAAIPHVARVIPDVQDFYYVQLGSRSEPTATRSARHDDEGARRRVVAGRFFDAADERGAVLSESLAYRLGLSSDAAIAGAVGRTLRLESRGVDFDAPFRIFLAKAPADVSRAERAALNKVSAQLPGALEKFDLDAPEVAALRAALAPSTPTAPPEVYRADLPIVGVLRPPTDEESKLPGADGRTDADLLLPAATAFDLLCRSPAGAREGVYQATLIVDDAQDVKDVVAAALGAGVQARSAVEFIERERLVYLMIFGAMTCVAGVALIVAALGIANTMLMSVLERRREIGIMKAVGADDRHLLIAFLVEGALIGLLGALAGLLLTYAASFPADAWVRSMVQRDLKVDLTESIFVFPAWLVLSVPAFTVLVTTLAALYPARRAARLDPVAALRSE